MANELKRVGVVFTAEGVMDFKSALQEVNASIGENIAAYKLAQSEWTGSTKASEKLADKQKYLAQQTADYQKKVELLTRELAQMESAENRDETAIKKKKAQLDQAKTQLNRYQSALDDVTKSLETGAARLEDYADKAKKIGSTMEDVGETLTKNVTAPIAAVGAASIKTAADFSQQMSKVEAISGASAASMEALGSKAKEMGSKTKFSAVEAGEAMEYMAVAGWKTEDMLDGIAGVMHLAAASGEDLGKTSDILTDGLTAFGMAAEDAGHFADVLAAASSNSNTNVSMLGESFKYVAPLAGSLGYSIEDTCKALGLMADAGIKGSQAGTALRTILTNMLNPSNDMSYAMDQLGVSLTDDNGKMLSLGEVIESLRSGFDGLKMSAEDVAAAEGRLTAMLEDGAITEEQYNEDIAELAKQAFGAENALKAQTAAMLAGKNGLSGLLAIVGASDEDYAKLTAAVGSASEAYAKTSEGVMLLSEAESKGLEVTEVFAGKAEAMAAVMNDNLSGRVTELKSKLEGLSIQIGEILMPYAEKLVAWLQRLVDWFSNLSPKTQEVIVKIAGVAAAIGPLLVVGGKLFSGLGSILSTGAKLIRHMDDIMGAIGLVKGVVSSFVSGASSLLTGLFSLIMAHPVIAVVAAVVAAVVLLYNKCEWFRDCVDAIVSRIHDTVVSITQGIMDKVPQLWESGKARILDVIDRIRTGAIERFTAIKDGIADKIQAAKDAVQKAIDAIKGMMNFSWSLPNLKLPHFSISGNFSLNPPSIPKIGVEWYAKGGILTKPTVFGQKADGTLLGGGESGYEAVLPVSLLKQYVREASQEHSGTLDLDKLFAGIKKAVKDAVKEANLKVELDGEKIGEFVARTAAKEFLGVS